MTSNLGTFFWVFIGKMTQIAIPPSSVHRPQNGNILKYLPGTLLVMLTFLWGHQVPVGNVTVNLYTLIAATGGIILVISSTPVQFSSIFLVFLTIGLAQYFMGSNEALSFRSLSASFILALVIPFTMKLLEISRRDGFRSLFLAFKYGLYIQLIVQVVQVFLTFMGFNILFAPHYFLPILRPFGVFLEPSHVALGLAPFIYLLAMNPRQFIDLLGFHTIFVLLTILFLCPSFTLIAIISFVSFLYFMDLRKLSLRRAVFWVLILASIGWSWNFEPVQVRTPE
jgi:hypothetical protein